MTRTHIAIVRPFAAEALLSGNKRIETRFYQQRRPPFGQIAAGEIVHFKISGGDLIGCPQVTEAKELESLSPGAIRRIRSRFNHAILAPREYWAARDLCRLGILIWLTPLTRPSRPVVIPRQFGAGWIILDTAP